MLLHSILCLTERRFGLRLDLTYARTDPNLVPDFSSLRYYSTLLLLSVLESVYPSICSYRSMHISRASDNTDRGDSDVTAAPCSS